MKNVNNSLVCFFDSGIGGISLLCECVKILPCVDFAYFADNYNVPYGNFSHDELIEKVDGIFIEIEKLNPAAAVVACNTVTAHCIEHLRNKFKFEIIGIQPAVKPAAKNGSCVVLATPSTAQSASLKGLVAEFGENRTQVVACPYLATYVEENIGAFTDSAIESMLPKVETDGIVLGCTHYVFIEEAIKRFYNCPVYDGIAATAAHLREKLGNSVHCSQRAQEIHFFGGDSGKNKAIFRSILQANGGLSQNCLQNPT